MPLRPLYHSTVVVALGVVMAACARGDAQTAADSPAAAPVLGAAPTATPPAPIVFAEGTVGHAIRNHRLTMAEMTKWVGVIRSLQAKARKDSTLNLRLGYQADSTVESQARAVEQTPVLRETLAKAGMSSRDWVVVTMSYIGASMTAQAADSTRPVPPDVNPENVAFVRQHRNAIEALQKR